MKKAVDCADVLRMVRNESGVYEIWPMSRLTESKAIHVYCDMGTNGGGWTVSLLYTVPNSPASCFKINFFLHIL